MPTIMSLVTIYFTSGTQVDYLNIVTLELFFSEYFLQGLYFPLAF